jgi:lambda family phage tail tape measure protein
MATEKLIIEVREKGAAKASKNIAGIGKAGSSAGAGVQLLKRALVALGGAAAIRELVGLLDTFTNMQNRLRLVTKSTAELNLVTKELFGISKRTRSSFEGTATIFSRVALASKELGVSNAETLAFTESLNQAVILSGVSATEAEAGLIQLSQGLASGALRGDELRSVLEQLPFVADVISKELGVTRGKLREMGQEGKITSKIIFDAFQNAREELVERFGQTVPTVGQALTNLKTTVIELIGAFDSNTGAAAILATAIQLITDNLGTLVRIMGAAGLLGTVVLLSSAMTKLNASLRVFNALLLANPAGAILKVLAVIISLLVVFSDKISFGGEQVVTLADIFTATFNVINGVMGRGIEIIANFVAGLTGLGVRIPSIGDIISNTFSVIVKSIDAFIGIFVGLTVAIIKGVSKLPQGLKDLFIQAFNGVIGIVESSVNFILEQLNKVLAIAGRGPVELVEIGRLENTAAGGAEALGAAIKDGFLAGFKVNLLERAVGAISGEAKGVAAAREAAELAAKQAEEDARKQLGEKGPAAVVAEKATKKGKSFADIKKELEQENALLRLNSVEREKQAAIFQAETTLKRSLTAAEKEELGALLDLNAQLAVRADILDELQAPQLELAQGQEALNGLLAEGAITADQYNQKLRQLSIAALQADTSLEGGLKRGLLSIGEEFTNLSTLVESTMVSAFQGAEDALVSFVQTGKLDFKSLVDSIFADLARIAVRGAITGPIAGLLSGQAQGAGSTGGEGGGGFLASLGGIASSLFGGGGGTGQPSTGSGGGGGGLAQLAALGANLAFRNGGSFNVGGSGGPDSQLVAFRASPGENVQINKPGQGGGRSVVVNMNISTPDADSFQRNQTQILAKTQASLQRANSRNN